MSASHATRQTGRLPTSIYVALRRLCRGVRGAALALFLVAALGAWAGAIVGAPAFAAAERGGEGGGSPGEAEPSPTGTSNCRTPNPPNQLTLVAGTPQTITLDTAFANGLQVALTNSDGCAVTGAAGVAVTFSAPASGASGVFSTSNSNTVTVGADAAGDVTAPAFTANGSAGSYTVRASSAYGSVSFALTNTAAGVPARLIAIPLKGRSTTVGRRFPRSLQVRVLDADGNPVAGVAVTFALGSAGGGRCAMSAAASASFAGGGTQASATTGADGLATSPQLAANAAAGSFLATASLSSGGGGGGGNGGGNESVAKAGMPSIPSVRFSLTNLAGKPAKVTAGVGSTQSTPAGTAFPIRLAVTVTDAEQNPIPGALVTFAAPASGGLFTVRTRGSRRHRAHGSRRPRGSRHRAHGSRRPRGSRHRAHGSRRSRPSPRSHTGGSRRSHGRISYVRTVVVRTGACGIAVAPPFTASRQPGGYVVVASAKPARPAAFALVNEAG